MGKRVVATVFLGAMLWGSASGAAEAEPSRLAVFPFTGGAKVSADELSLLSDIVNQGLSELPKSDYAVEPGAAPEGGDKKTCDAQCLLEGARSSGAAFVAVCELKKVKGGNVMTVTLFAATDGQILLSSVSELCPDLDALMAAARTAVVASKEKLASLIPPPPPEPAAVPPAPVAPPPPAEPLPGTLRITSAPPGAHVLIGSSKRDPGKPAGSAPVAVPLKAWSYWVTLTMPGYLEHREKIDLAVGQTLDMNVSMEVDRWPALRIAAHATLWPGIAFGLLAGTGGYLGWYYGKQYEKELGSSDGDASRRWAVIMWASGGLSAALLTTSIVCFVLLKKEPKLTARIGDTAFGAGPTGDGGGVFAFQRRF